MDFEGITYETKSRRGEEYYQILDDNMSLRKFERCLPVNSFKTGFESLPHRMSFS